LSGGVCAKINEICSAALRTAANRGATLIDASFFPAEASKSKPTAAVVPARPAAEPARRSRLAVAIPACAIASLVISGLWYASVGRGRADLGLDSAQRLADKAWSLSDNRIDHASPEKSFATTRPRISKPRASNGQPDTKILPRRNGHSFAEEAARESSNRPAASVVIAPNPLADHASLPARNIPSHTSAAPVVSLPPHVSPSAPAGAAPQSKPEDHAEAPALAGAGAPSPIPAAVVEKTAPAPKISDTALAGASGPSTAPSPPSPEAQSGLAQAAEHRMTALALQQAAFETKLGDAYMRLGEYDNAIRSFKIALGLTPGDAAIAQRIERARRAKTAEESTLR
jgi:hypothetical protein